jgi:hypothetical protein
MADTGGPRLWPVTVAQARYGGIYEGGRWVAFLVAPWHVPEDAFGDDVTCANWWDSPSNSAKVGRGNTPDEAVHDLARRLGEPR